MEKVLVVIDMQNDFIDGTLGTPEAQTIVDRVADKIRSFDGKIFVTLDTHDSNYMSTLEGKKLPVEHCIKRHYGWLLNEKIQTELDKKKSVHYVEKNTFGSSDLWSFIRTNTKETDPNIEIVGLVSNICVVTNALLLKTYFDDSNIVVDASCCAGTTPEAHKAAIEVMKSCQIDVINE